MKKIFLSALIIGLSATRTDAQSSEGATATDVNYLVDNLSRTRELLIRETQSLSDEQWNFKESADRWSIKQVVEHIATWELLFQREISQALAAGPQPDLNKTAQPDSIFANFIMEEKKHITTDYTKPFTFSVPMGLNDGKNNLAWFKKLRDESIQYLSSTKEDIRSYYLKPGRPNVYQLYITTFGHTDRHLRQILKVKSHPKYPK